METDLAGTSSWRRVSSKPQASCLSACLPACRGQKVILGKDEVQECLEVDGQQLKYIQVSGLTK